MPSVSNGWTSAPVASSKRKNRGVSSATPSPAIAARASCSCTFSSSAVRAAQGSQFRSIPAAASHRSQVGSRGLTQGSGMIWAGSVKGPWSAAIAGDSMGAKSTSNRRCAISPGQSPAPQRIATSMSSRAKSTRWAELSSRTASPGFSIWNRPSRCESQFPAIVGRAEIDSVSVSLCGPKAPRRVSNASCVGRASRAPSAVSSIPRGLRRKSAAPSRSSSRRIW